jgi:hypothetical protein
LWTDTNYTKGWQWIQLVAINKRSKKSPFDIEGIDTDITTEEILEFVSIFTPH